VTQSQNSSIPDPERDGECVEVVRYLEEMPHLQARTVRAVRDAVDEVLRGDRTRRYSIEQLTRQEKAHIGTQVEIALVRELFDGIEGTVLDTKVNEIEVDIKNTIGTNWMIPHEAVGRICVLVRINESTRQLCLGVVRTKDGWLGAENQDGKRSLNGEGRRNIHWILPEVPFPVSVFLGISEEDKTEIWNKNSGDARLRELFRRVQGRIIVRNDIVTLGNQKDAMNRARKSKAPLLQEGILVLCGTWVPDRERAAGLGHAIGRDEWISVRLQKPEG
jgi:hypothetical protein